MENKTKKRIVSLALASILTTGIKTEAKANTEFTVSDHFITNHNEYVKFCKLIIQDKIYDIERISINYYIQGGIITMPPFLY